MHATPQHRALPYPMVGVSLRQQFPYGKLNAKQNGRMHAKLSVGLATVVNLPEHHRGAMETKHGTSVTALRGSPQRPRTVGTDTDGPSRRIQRTMLARRRKMI